MATLFAQLPPAWVLAAVFAIVVAGAVVQAGLGMGFGLVAAPLLALIAPDLVPVPVLWVGFVTSALAGWTDRSGVVWPEVWLGALGRAAGVVVAVGVLALVSGGPGFSLVFGAFVAAAVALSLSGWRIAFNRVSLVVMAAVSGVMGTITSIGAPPLAMIYQGRPAAIARPTLGSFFAVGVALSLAGLYLSGFAGLRDLWLAGLMVPPMLLGTWAGRRVRGRFDARYRLAMLAISGSAAVILIARGLSGLVAAT